MKIEEFAKKYIQHIKDNLYEINFNEKDMKDIKCEIIHQKNQFTEELTLDGLLLVRTVKYEYFPSNMIYYPLDYRNCYNYVDNPFKFIIGWAGIKAKGYQDINLGCEIDGDQFRKNKLITYLYRNTKHFAINGLASNVYRLLGPDFIFDDGEVVIIEKLKNKINDKRLVNLNPVDTFFDLEGSEMEIDENAVILIKKDKFSSISEEMKKNIGNRKIFLFEGNSQIATDIVIMSMGILPQHSEQQSILKTEYYFEEGKEINDKNYLNNFINLIEQLNQQYLDMSYINIPKDIENFRKEHFREMIGKPGVLHAETKYGEIEKDKNLEYELRTYEEYLNFLSKYSKVLDALSTKKIYETIRRDVVETSRMPISQNFSSTYDEHEELLKKVLIDFGYPKFVNLTKCFNKQRLKTIDKTRIG